MSNTSGYLFVTLAALLWAISGTVGKYLFQGATSPADVVQTRLILGALGLFLVLSLQGRLKSLRIRSLGDLLRFVALGTLGFAANQFFYFLAIQKSSVAVAIFLEFTAPAMITLYAWSIQKRKLGGRTALGLGCAMAGCCLISFDTLGGASVSASGLAAGLAAAVAFSAYSLMSETLLKRYSPTVVLMYALWVAGIFWNLAHPPMHWLRASHSLLEWSLMFYIGILGTLVPFASYLVGVQKIGSPHASMTATLEPVFATILAFAFLGESLSFLQAVGAVAISFSVLLISSRPKS